MTLASAATIGRQAANTVSAAAMIKNFTNSVIDDFSSREGAQPRS